MGQRRFIQFAVGSLLAATLVAGAAQAAPSTSGPAPRASTPSVKIMGQGFSCQFAGGVFTSFFSTSDSVASAEPYPSAGKTLYADLQVCQGSGGPATRSHAEFGNRLCTDEFPISVHTTSSEVASFADTEALFVCSVPDDDGHGDSSADNVPLSFVRQGFKCPVTVYTGSGGNTPKSVTSSDSIEVRQTYKTYNGPSTTATTTTCIGKLPSGTVAATHDVAHQSSCAEAGPSGSGTIQGSATFATYTDGQYEETCNVPNASLGSTSPVAGKNVVGGIVTGTILVRVPGSKKFVTLRPGQPIPLGSLVDATHGRVRLTSAKDRAGHTATGVFYAGEFRVTQTPSHGNEVTVLTLAGPKPGGCSVAKGATVARKRPKRRRKRSLWGSARGDFRTKGSYASATERGTKWLTQDSCSGTLIHVTQGAVTVTDFPHHRTFLLKAPHSFIAHPGRGG